MIMRVVMYATRTLRAPRLRSFVVTVSLLLLASVGKFVVTSSVQSTVVDIVNGRDSCRQMSSKQRVLCLQLHTSQWSHLSEVARDHSSVLKAADLN